ncbi:hypothetical protein [Propioniciclava sinopodophylli]|uniref:hypothetical protein n=1 Tax=Propioniciclava sinopodophylli TaxID=1837344 RepID=UPI002493B9E3|nr:hypothetical protein [Propioniciclava sinopodophylli]
MTWTAAGIVAAWELASGLTPPRRTAALLHASGRAADEESALAMDVGTAASLLVASYAEAFGASVDVVTACASCGSQLEAEIALPLAAPGAASARLGDLAVRLPTLRELDLVHGLPDAGVRLSGWCVTSTGDDPAGFPAELDALADELAGAASLHGAVVCPECGAVFDATLDPAAVLWERICADAPRLLGEVAALARAFGWSESQILALSDARRDAYLDLVGAP